MDYLIYKIDEINKSLLKEETKEQFGIDVLNSNIKILKNLEGKSKTIRQLIKHFLSFKKLEKDVSENKLSIISEYNKENKTKVNIKIEPSIKEEIFNIRERTDIPVSRLINWMITYKGD